MTNDELAAALGRRDALVVHFSHHSDMGNGVVFPNDLQFAITNIATKARSCCVVWPGHRMDLPGSVGVVFRPTVANVLSVFNSDSGSSDGRDGSDNSAGVPLTQESFLASFEVRGLYNEWRVKGAAVCGIFVANVRDILVKKHLSVPGGPDGPVRTIGADPTSLGDVFRAFPGVPVFTIENGKVLQVPAPPV
jgi:hypothetical protein